MCFSIGFLSITKQIRLSNAAATKTKVHCVIHRRAVFDVRNQNAIEAIQPINVLNVIRHPIAAAIIYQTFHIQFNVQLTLTSTVNTSAMLNWYGTVAMQWIIFKILPPLIFVQDNVTDGNKRGCISKQSELEECEQNPKTCRLCMPTATGACNSFVFPDDRRKCIECYSGSRNCPNEHKTDTVNKYSVSCKLTVDRCVIMNRGYGHQWQLCESDLNESEKKFCSDNKDRCTFCDKKDNCNWDAKLDKLYSNSPTLSVCTSIILILPIISRIAF